MLQEKGYNIARRTVAKYREQLNIPWHACEKELYRNSIAYIRWHRKKGALHHTADIRPAILHSFSPDIFIPTHVVAFLVSFHPSYFAGFSAGLKLRILLITILNTAFSRLLGRHHAGLNFIVGNAAHTARPGSVPTWR